MAGLIDGIVKATNWLEVHGYGEYIPAEALEIRALKRRDKREPGRVVKESYEASLALLMRRMFAQQSRKVEQYISSYYPGRKAVEVVPDWVFEIDDKLRATIINMFIRAAIDGVKLFQETGAGRIGLDWTMVNKKAVDWAMQYTTEWLAALDDVTSEAVRSAVSAFADTPGMTIRQVMDMLPFDEARRKRVAITEITRVFAQSEQIAGEELQAKYPDVKVFKEWFTNADDIVRVCDICRPLNGMTAPINGSFGGYDKPPAHVNCRCWMSTYTDIEA